MSKARWRINAILLAGGKNSRMAGADKAFLEIEGKPIIERLINRFKSLVNEIIVVTNSPERYSGFDCLLVKDALPGLGPLMGIYSGLTASSELYNFICACDMPFVNQGLVKYMIGEKNTYDVVAADVEGKLHPLFGIYSKNCIPVIEELLKQNILNVRSLFSKVRSRFIKKEELEKFDPELLSLVNINTREVLRSSLLTEKR